MRKKRFIKIGDRSFPVTYNMAEFEELEKHFNVPLSGLFQEIQANFNTSTISVLVKVGLEGGEYASGKSDPKIYTIQEVDELLSGRVVSIARQFMEAAAEDLGIEVEEEQTEGEKNLKARKQSN